MPETSPLNMIMQQLDSLSLVEMIKIREKIDALIQSKSSLFSNISSVGSYRVVTSILRENKDIDVIHFSAHGVHSSSHLENINFNQYQVAEQDDTLEQVVELVDEWISDESRYDEETYPAIEAALNQNQLSL